MSYFGVSPPRAGLLPAMPRLRRPVSRTNALSFGIGCAAALLFVGWIVASITRHESRAEFLSYAFAGTALISGALFEIGKLRSAARVLVPHFSHQDTPPTL